MASMIRLMVLTLGAAVLCTPAQALTLKECSAKYDVAKKEGTLKDRSWNDFRKGECGGDAKAAEPGTKSSAAGSKADDRKASAADAVFPSAVAAKYAGEKASKARMHTCRDQYKANKDKNANGGLRWIQRGGGYYSQCNKRLKAL